MTAPLAPRTKVFAAVLKRLSTPVEEAEDHAALRAERDRLMKSAAGRLVFGRPDRRVRTEEVEIPLKGRTLRALVHRPTGVGGARPVVVNFHGGGWVQGSPEQSAWLASRVAAGTGAVVISPSYRLAPEHPFPAATDDTWESLGWIVENAERLGIDPDRLAVMGDSAGGNLAAAVCLMARDAGGPRPAAQVLVYPVIDPACDSESARRYATGYFNTLAATKWYWSQYLPEDGVLPEPTAYAAPLTAATLADLPAAIVVTAGLDPLCSEGEEYATALAAAGVPVIHREYADLFHGFLTILPMHVAEAARQQLWRDLTALLDDVPAEH